jgi:cell division initiation protein
MVTAMNYTPNDLDNIKFKKTFMGYSEDQVNDVLDNIIQDYEMYIKENIELKDRISVLNEGIQHYKNIEDSLQNTLIVAQQTGEEIKKNAYEKADNIVKEAEIRSQKILNDSNQEIIKVKFEYEEMKKNLHLFKSKSEMLLLSQLELLKQMFSNEDEKEKQMP